MLTGPNGTATKEAGEPNHGANPGGHSLWWGWTAPAPGEVTVTTAGSDFDTLLAVYTGDSVTSLAVVDSQDRGIANERIVFHAAAGSSYNIAVDGYNGAVGNAMVNISFTPSPLNDDFSSRMIITGYPLSVATTNTAATKEPGEPSLIAGYQGGASVWWSWTTPVTGLLTATTEGTEFDALLSIWTGNEVSSLASVAQQDRRPFESISFRAEAGVPYAIAIDGYQAGTGKAVLNLSFVISPVNDDFKDRTILMGRDITLTASNVASTFEVGEPTHVGRDGGKSVWWTWTPTGSGPALISTEGSSLDTLLAVYQGAAVTNLVGVASSDMTLGDTVEFNAVAGTEYQIAVDGYHGGEGVFPLRLVQSVSTPLSSSDFRVDRDFWRTVSFPDGGPFIAFTGGPFYPAYVSTNGNPGGYLSQSDPDGNTWFWKAPMKFLGDQSAAYGGSLRFELRQSAIDSQFTSADLILAGAEQTLVYAHTNYPGVAWTSYTVPLVENGGWRKDNLNGAIPTQEEFRSILHSVTALYIRGEFRNGGDVGDLDNVAWAAALELPELTAALEADGRVRLSWPGFASNFILLTSSALGSGSDWFPVTNERTSENGEVVVRLQPVSENQFYKLARETP